MEKYNVRMSGLPPQYFVNLDHYFKSSGLVHLQKVLEKMFFEFSGLVHVFTHLQMYESAGLKERLPFTFLQICESAGLDKFKAPPQYFSLFFLNLTQNNNLTTCLPKGRFNNSKPCLKENIRIMTSPLAFAQNVCGGLMPKLCLKRIMFLC